ncbi:MAG: hypothetical protein PVI90_09035 [Desulfobacteraceae bacterium]|jgi:hypothetical protein
MIIFLIALLFLISYGTVWVTIPRILTSLLLLPSNNINIITAIILFSLLVFGMIIVSSVIILLLSSIQAPIKQQIHVALLFSEIILMIICAIGLQPSLVRGRTTRPTQF